MAVMVVGGGWLVGEVGDIVVAVAVGGVSSSSGDGSDGGEGGVVCGWGGPCHSMLV